MRNKQYFKHKQYILKNPIIHTNALQVSILHFPLPYTADSVLQVQRHTAAENATREREVSQNEQGRLDDHPVLAAQVQVHDAPGADPRPHEAQHHPTSYGEFEVINMI